MKLLLHGLNYAPEEIGIGKYSGEMVATLIDAGWDVTVVTTPPYYPQWRIATGFRGWWWSRDQVRAASPWHKADAASGRDGGEVSAGKLSVIRCPLWVPRKVNGWKRVLHLASYGLSSIPPLWWQAIRQRPDVIMTVEPAAFCMPSTLVAARLCGAQSWLHVQDFEVDAAFELGILKSRRLRGWVTGIETWLMRRFARVSSISPNMLAKLRSKGVSADNIRHFPNWVDCQAMRPLEDQAACRDMLGLPHDKRIALYAGNIGAKQGLDLLVDAARRCRNPAVLFVICGHGAAYDSLAAQAAGVPNLQLLPVQPFERFNQLMNCADVHLLPQKGNAADLVMPSKLTGMLATGRPVVACSNPGTQIAQVVQGCGCVVPPGDVDALLAAVELLADDPVLCQNYGRAAREYAMQELSAPAILQRFIGELNELLDGQTPGCAATGLDLKSPTASDVDGKPQVDEVMPPGQVHGPPHEPLAR